METESGVLPAVKNHMAQCLDLLGKKAKFQGTGCPG